MKIPYLFGRNITRITYIGIARIASEQAPEENSDQVAYENSVSSWKKKKANENCVPSSVPNKDKRQDDDD